jgi:drug/metabolite transporter (DMT)-like permease
VTSSSSHLRAIGFGCLGFTLWVIADSCMKLACELGAPKYQIMAIGSFSGMGVIFILSLLRGQLPELRPRHYRGLSALGGLFVLSYACWILALPLLPLANFYTVAFMGPIIVSLLATAILGEKLSVRKIIAALFGFGGVIIATGFATSSGGSWKDGSMLGYVFAAGGTLMMVGQQLTLRFMGERETGLCKVFYPRIFAGGAGLAAGLILGFAPMPAMAWVYGLITGGLGSLGWLCVAKAYKLAPAGTVAPFQYSQIVSSAFLGYAIWGDVPSAHLLVGAAIIIVSGIYIALHTHRAQTALDIVEL